MCKCGLIRAIRERERETFLPQLLCVTEPPAASEVPSNNNTTRFWSEVNYHNFYQSSMPRNAKNGFIHAENLNFFWHILDQISIFSIKRKIIVITTQFFPLVRDILMVSLTIVVTPFSLGRYPLEKNVSISLLSTILHLQWSR